MIAGMIALIAHNIVVPLVYAALAPDQAAQQTVLTVINVLFVKKELIAVIFAQICPRVFVIEEGFVREVTIILFSLIRF